MSEWIVVDSRPEEQPEQETERICHSEVSHEQSQKGLPILKFQYMQRELMLVSREGPEGCHNRNPP